MCAFGFTGAYTLVYGVCGWVHEFYCAGGLVAVDIGALERELWAAWNTESIACGFALRGHFR
jgi:hypothetical protein